LRAIEKMIKVLNKDGKIIITVPAGQPILSGDINPGNKMPFLRRYDEMRINLIMDLANKNGMEIQNTFFYSENFNDWFESDKVITTPQYSQANNPYTPNMIWAFTMKHK
jgi:hypothetical protein